MYPLNSIPFNKKDPLCRVSADWLNTVSNMLSGVQIVMVDGQDYAEVVAPTQQGDNWQFKIPSGGAGGAPDTTGASKEQVYQITDDATTPPAAGFAWAAACAETVTVHRTDGSTIILSLRPVTVCVDDVEKTAWVLMSEPT